MNYAKEYITMRLTDRARKFVPSIHDCKLISSHATCLKVTACFGANFSGYRFTGQL